MFAIAMGWAVFPMKNRPTHSNGKHSMLIDMNGDGLLDRVFDKNPTNDQQGLYVYLNTGHSFDSGKQWQTNLGGDLNWKNHPIHSYGYNGKHSMLIDMNGDSLIDIKPWLFIFWISVKYSIR
jgi:hypothetical protein